MPCPYGYGAEVFFMNMKIDIRGLKDFQQRVDTLAKSQVPYALMSALNSTAYNTMQAEKKEIKDSFKRPTPFVQRGIFYQKASKAGLSAFVRIADERDRFNVRRILDPHVYGGGRMRKASENRLIRAGAMGGGQWMVPGVGAPRDAYKNISGGQMQRILGYVRQYTERGYSATKQTGGHYLIPFVGVFRRTGRKGKRASVPVLHFTYAKPQYEQRFEFHYTARSYYDKNFLRHMNEAWNRALTSAVAR